MSYYQQGRRHEHCHCNDTKNEKLYQDMLNIIVSTKTEKLYQNVFDTIVTISAVFPGNRIIRGTGFFISKTGYIVTAAHVILFGNGIDPESPKANEVFATITNVNGKKENNIQVLCKIVGVDRAGDIAVLKNYTKSENPKYGYDIYEHNSLKWGCSTCTSIYSNCHIIGYPLGEDILSPSHGIVRDNKFSSPIAVEGVITNAPTYSGNSGSPIMNDKGEVIAVLSANAGEGIVNFNGGMSQYLAEFVVNKIIKTNSDYTSKGYLGATLISNWDSLLIKLRKLFPAFDNIEVGKPDGLVVFTLFPVSAGKGLSNATPTPIQQYDILLRAQIGKENIRLGVSNESFSISRLTWRYPVGTKMNITFIRPSDGITRVSEVILDNYPIDKDIFLSVASSIGWERDEIERDLNSRLDGN